MYSHNFLTKRHMPALDFEFSAIGASALIDAYFDHDL